MIYVRLEGIHSSTYKFKPNTHRLAGGGERQLNEPFSRLDNINYKYGLCLKTILKCVTYFYLSTHKAYDDIERSLKLDFSIKKYKN